VIAHKNLEDWEELKEFFRNMYIEKGTPDFHAIQLLKARHNKSKNVSVWIERFKP
jgi:hypothetical protein